LVRYGNPRTIGALNSGENSGARIAAGLTLNYKKLIEAEVNPLVTHSKHSYVIYLTLRRQAENLIKRKYSFNT
jgi:hypothetical protein